MCSVNFNYVIGAFTSPWYPENYPSNMDCTLTIGFNMNLQNARIAIVFHSFHMENGDCRYENTMADIKPLIKGKDI